MTEENEFFFARHNIFIRKARDACHQSLFFLGMLYESNTKKATSAIIEYRKFGLHQIKGLVRGVYIPSECSDKIADLNNIDEDDKKDAVLLCEKWKEIGEYLKNNPELSLEKIPKLREDLLDFLRTSQAKTFWENLTVNHFTAFLQYLRKNLSSLWGIALVVFASRVEVVNGLLSNEGWWILLPLMLLLVPVIVNRAFISALLRKVPSSVPCWDIGGHSMRSIRELAVEPGRLVQRWPADAPILRYIMWGQIWRLLAYFLWWIIALLILSIKGGSTITVYAFLWMGLLVLIIANILDYWDFISKLPVRFLVLLAAFICVFFLLFGYGREIFITYFLVSAGFFAYLYIKVLAQNKKRSIYLVVAIIFLVIAVGTTIGRFTHKSQEWTSKNVEGGDLERLTDDSWPMGPENGPPVAVMATSGGGSRAAVFTGLTLRHINEDTKVMEIAQNLQAISSVSGGSLANAAYIARLLSLSENLGGDSYESSRIEALKDLPDALKVDFILPTLKGAFVPGLTRGESIEEEWREGKVKLGDYRLSNLVKNWNNAKAQGASTPPFPIPLFNTASLEGHDVVISPLAMNFYTNSELHHHARSEGNYYNIMRDKTDSDNNDPTWVFYRYGIYGLENFLAKHNPLLSSAVRASANFPFGFPLVKVRPKGDLYFSPEPRQEFISLTDGGALSNSGMWSLFHLLINKRDKLCNRGVLLIIVDAGKMPVYRNLQKSITSLVGTIQDQSPIGQNLHRRMYDLLKETYNKRIAIVKFDLMELESYNVMTTWPSIRIRWKRWKNRLISNGMVERKKFQQSGNVLRKNNFSVMYH